MFAARILIMMIFPAIVTALFANGQAAIAEDNETIKSLVDKYNHASDHNKRVEVYTKLSDKKPKTQEDVEDLRKVFLRKDWDEILFAGSVKSIQQISDPTLDNKLIEILKDEKAFIEKASRGDKGGKSDKEVDYRVRNVEFIIYRLGQFKSRNAVSILKEYLGIEGIAYRASEALAKIGDKSATEEMKDKAYKGEDINYGGQGLDEALTIIRDLEDQSKKDKWPKIAKQLFHIRDRRVKPYLKRLFNHEQDYIRWEAADKFRKMVDENDVPTIIEMTKNRDSMIRAEAIHAMQNLKNIEFGDELIALLKDPASNVRRTAAKALGYKKISRAVPYLEKAIKDSELRDDNPNLGRNEKLDELLVRQEAYIALYILTGKKYEYRGKNAIIEREAEEQKRFPTFY